MSTQAPSLALDAALGSAPKVLRTSLIKAYLQLKRDHAEARFEAAGLSAGKLCEVSLRILQDSIFGAYTPLGTKIDNFADECRKLITSPKTAGAESARIVLPRALVFLYTMRNKRGIGHIGGDVEANSIDAATIARVADWIVCELIRIFHSIPLEDAQALIDNLAVRSVPEVWSVGGKYRVLRKGLSARQNALLLMYSNEGAFVLLEDLFDWVEYSTLSMFIRRIISPLHKERLIEYDKENGLVYLSPIGIAEVETDLLKKAI